MEMEGAGGRGQRGWGQGERIWAVGHACACVCVNVLMWGLGKAESHGRADEVRGSDSALGPAPAAK